MKTIVEIPFCTDVKLICKLLKRNVNEIESANFSGSFGYMKLIFKEVN
jgi:hypothetical protein